MAADVETRPCKSCDGSGEEFDHDAAGGYVMDCRDCHGSGKVPYRGSKKAEAPPAAAPPPPDAVA
jgi:DnaJ-class molecular chaperone